MEEMKAAEVFGIIVRTIGLLVVLSSLGLIFPAVLGLVMGGPGTLIGMLFYGIPALLLGLWLLRGARPVVSFAFPEEQPKD
jgi:hypothetical protein